MSVVDGGSSSGLVQRVQDILLRPKPTWDVIDAEPATVAGLYKGYICILALIPAVAGVIGALLAGGPVGAMAGLVVAVLGYVVGLAVVYVMALVTDGLAPSFGGQKNQIQAFKVIAYSMTPAWVGGVLTIVPGVGPFLAWLVSLYSIYLMYLGLPKLMKAPEDKAIAYTAVVVVIYIVISIIVGAILASIALMGLFTGAVASGAYG
ncbi:MAG: YIP1 family protein [Caulobacter sp.]|nr:YIP1 family protein [Caulobacter sp.]